MASPKFINNPIEKSILKTVCYSDIFDFPLKKEEIYRFLIEKKVKKKDLSKALINLKKQVEEKDGYYFLPGRKDIVNLRKSREKNAEEKIQLAKKTTDILKKIPFIEMVGITGSLSMKNTPKDDDIDLFIVTKNNMLWTTRFLSTVLIEILGIRRRPNQKNVKDKICLNMFLDGSTLQVDKKDQNIYTAHEVCQLIPIFDRNGTYKKFIKKNKWIKSFLPNWKTC